MLYYLGLFLILLGALLSIILMGCIIFTSFGLLGVILFIIFMSVVIGLGIINNL